MAYIGAEPAYGVFQRQVLTGDGSTTQYNLDYAVAQPTSLLVSLDGVVQEPVYSYIINVYYTYYIYHICLQVFMIIFMHANSGPRKAHTTLRYSIFT